MPLNKQLLADELSVLLGAHHQGAKQASRSRETSTHPKLKHMVATGLKANLRQARRLEQALALMGVTPVPQHDTGMQGICDRNEMDLARNKDLVTRDLLNIAYGRVAAYFYIAKYEFLESISRALGYTQVAKLLRKTKKETHETNREFGRLYEHLVKRRASPDYPGESALRATAAMHPALTVGIIGVILAGVVRMASSLPRRS